MKNFKISRRTSVSFVSGNERDRPVGRSCTTGTRCRRVHKFLSAGLQLRWPPPYVAELHKRRRTSRKFANGLLTQPVPHSTLLGRTRGNTQRFCWGPVKMPRSLRLCVSSNVAAKDLAICDPVDLVSQVLFFFLFNKKSVVFAQINQINPSTLKI